MDDNIHLISNTAEIQRCDVENINYFKVDTY